MSAVVVGSILFASCDKPFYVYTYPKLTLAASDVGGQLFMGPSAQGSSGCDTLEASATGSEIVVTGTRYPRGVGCTANEPFLWKPILVPPGKTTITIVYKGRSGRYRISYQNKRVDVELISGKDVAPPASPDGWWEIPDDALIMTVRNSTNEAALTRSADRLRMRLEASGATAMVVPKGNPLVTASTSSEAPGSRLYSRRSEFESSVTATLIQEPYHADLVGVTLQSMAAEEAQLETCSSISLVRPLADEDKSGFASSIQGCG